MYLYRTMVNIVSWHIDFDFFSLSSSGDVVYKER